MPAVVVRVAFGVSGAQRQEGLGAIQGLDLALLVDAQDQRLLGRMQRRRPGA